MYSIVYSERSSAENAYASTNGCTIDNHRYIIRFNENDTNGIIIYIESNQVVYDNIKQMFSKFGIIIDMTLIATNSKPENSYNSCGFKNVFDCWILEYEKYDDACHMFELLRSDSRVISKEYNFYSVFVQGGKLEIFGLNSNMPTAMVKYLFSPYGEVMRICKQFTRWSVVDRSREMNLRCVRGNNSLMSKLSTGFGKELRKDKFAIVSN